MKVRDLFGENIRPIHTIASSRSVDEALRQMAEKKTSALIVIEDDQPVGIFAERDLFRYFLVDKTSALSEIDLHKAMTDKLIAASPEDDVGRLIAIMVKADIRHMPVIKKKKLVGLLTLNDLTEQQIESLNDEISQLKDYIEDLHEAGMD